MDIKELQLFLIRVYIGLDFVHHFAEKFYLLGPGPYNETLRYFATVSAHPEALMLLAGLCEFGAFVGFTFGLFNRIAAVGTTLYLLIALFMGNHQHDGFTWANPGGGWEYPALWAFICLSFVLSGGGRLSVDNILRNRLPNSLRFLSC